MRIQAYNDGGVRIFEGFQLICEFEIVPPLKPAIDKHLRKLRLRRRSKWVDAEWGTEAVLRFK